MNKRTYELHLGATIQKAKLIFNLFAAIFFVFSAFAGDKIKADLETLRSTYEGQAIVLIHKRTLFYSVLEKKSGWELENAVLENLPLVGTAHCLGGSRKTAPIPLFAAPNSSKKLHTIACSNINDWLASEKTGTPSDPFDKGVVVLREENGFFQVALAASLYKSDFTRKKMMSDFPKLGSWQYIYSAWIQKEALSPTKKPKNSEETSALKKLIPSQYDLDDLQAAHILVEKVHKTKNEFWLEVEISVIGAGFKKIAYAPILDSGGNPLFEIAHDGDPNQ